MDDAGAGPSGLQQLRSQVNQSLQRPKRGPKVDCENKTTSPKKKRMKQNPLSSTEKQTVINIYKQIKESWPVGTPAFRTQIINKTAEVAGKKPKPDFKRTSLYKIIKDKLKFTYVKRSRKSALIDKQEIVLWHVKYLHEIKRFHNEGRKIYYLDETWLKVFLKVFFFSLWCLLLTFISYKRITVN
ncbi:unnamed protein product [Diatraea saccharalis]|uniref:Uncharacterized protein n=1 Tax=Diatraea saccharalis TaxID=40085 RepID=A0A9N9WGV3_9NEOP|nr:unnamed protein product [Diatraea saccharalis]